MHGPSPGCRPSWARPGALKTGSPRGNGVARFARGSLEWLIAPPIVLVAVLVGWRVTGDTWMLGAAAGLVAVELFFVQFFRDPERQAAPGFASAADGRVSRIDQVTDPDLGPVDRLCVFMSPVDVHVNRFPIDGTVVSVTHHPGGHIPAWDKDSDRNERVVTLLDTAIGRVKVIQIAGTVARRIVPYIDAGHAATKGERLGLIRLGSRCDLLVPKGSVRWLVQLKQQVHAGSTQVGEFP